MSTQKQSAACALLAVCGVENMVCTAQFMHERNAAMMLSNAQVWFMYIEYDHRQELPSRERSDGRMQHGTAARA
jgi:hypothetical protein